MSQVSPSEAEAPQAGFPGDRLAEARQRLGLSTEQVATELRLSLQHVEALERADFSRLPSVVFTRGYIRAYARLVKIDGDDLVRHFDLMHGGERESAPIRTVTRVRPPGSSGPVTFGSLLLLVLVVVGATFWWWQTQYGHEVAVDDLPEPTVAVETADGKTLVFNAPETAPGAAVQPEAPEMTADAAEAAEVPAASSQAVASLEAPDVASPDEVALPEEAAPEQDAGQSDAEEEAPVVAAREGLFVRFSDDCWVTVKDGSGKTLFNNLRKAGQELHLPQSGPMNVLLGRVSAISEISFDGSAVDLEPFSNKNVARLRVPLSQ